MRHATLTTLLASTLALGATVAFAIEPQPLDPTSSSDVKPSFEALDVNKDGQVSKTEVPTEHELTTLFESFDADGNDALSRAEFEAYATADEEKTE